MDLEAAEGLGAPPGMTEEGDLEPWGAWGAAGLRPMDDHIPGSPAEEQHGEEDDRVPHRVDMGTGFSTPRAQSGQVRPCPC